MKLRLLLITFFLTITLAACDSADQSAEAPAEAPAEATEPAAAPTEAAPAEEAEIEDINEAAEEAAEETPADDSAADAEEIVVGDAPAAATDWQFEEGSHFRKMASSQGTSSAPDKIEVAEVFWYGCPHCYDFDPIIDEWKADLAPDVAFIRIPVIWNPTNQLHARVMYTAEALGKLDEIHPAVFKAMHQEGNTLTKEEDIVELFEKNGVSEEEFREAYNSFSVSSSVKRAENLTRRYGVRSVPVIIVNGKYATDGQEIKTFGNMLALTDELIERERTER
jgi:thiol:disulfide interchange protein DsbA